MFVKVCGITSAEQAHELSEITDFIGFIFYAKSPRYTTAAYPSMGAKKTGVFVNETLQTVIRTAQQEKLHVIQLHGNETPEYCAALQPQITVIKSFGIDDRFDFSSLEPYVPFVDYFLFDTFTLAHGGSGRSFDWTLLSAYTLDTPFILSGGLHPESLENLKHFSHPKWIGIDLNSGFETAPGIKNIEQLTSFIHAIKS